MKLGILLSTPPAHPNLRTVVSLVKTARDRGLDVYLYLVDDGLYTLDHPDIAAIGRVGVKRFACAYGAQRRGIPTGDQAVFCGLVVLSDLFKGCDRFITFN